MIDIADQKVFETYLLEKGIIKEGEDFFIKYLSGGVSGTTAFVQVSGQDLIIKQALAKLKVAEEWLCDPSRMEAEMKSNDIYHRLVPENVPKVISYDPENYVFVREAAPDSCRMWKSDLMTGQLDFEVSAKVMQTLATVHNKCAGDDEVAKDFADKEIFYELRISPYIEFILKKHPGLTDYAKPICDELMNSNITLVHGDYSPKNVVLDGRKVFVTDYEVAHYGHPAFDVAFLANHLILKAIHMRDFGGAFLAMLRQVLNLYFDQVDFMDKKALEISFVKLLPLLMIARVDGKSPVEYIVDEDVKEFVRTIAFDLINKNVTTQKELLDLLTDHIIV